MDKIAENNIVYTRYYTEPGSDITEKITLIPTGIDSGDPELINVKDIEQGITYNIDKTILNTEYKQESLQSNTSQNFNDVKKEIKDEKSSDGYNTFVNKIMSNDNLVIENTTDETPESYGINSADVDDYFTIYKILLKENYKLPDIAKASYKYNERVSPEYALYNKMQDIAADVIKAYRSSKKKDVLTQFNDIDILTPANKLYDNIYNIFLDIRKKTSKTRDDLIYLIFNQLKTSGKIDEEEFFSIKDFNNYIKESFYAYLEKVYNKVKSRVGENVSKEKVLYKIIEKVRTDNLKYSEECDKYNYNEFENFISKKTDQIANSLLNITENSLAKKEVFNLIRDKAIEKDPQLEQFRNKVNSESFEDIMATNYEEYKDYKENLLKVVDIIKSVNPSLTVYGLVSFYAWAYDKIKLKKSNTILPIIKLAYSIELVKQGKI